MTEEEAKRYIRLTRPKAKFDAYSHTDNFMDLEAQIGKGFFYISLYDELVDANLVETPKGVLVIGNTYLSSFAYNLILAWIYEHKEGKINRDTINPLIKYNFKKFFAEQLYHNINNIFSRAVLLETLLYEQQLMIPVFEAANTNLSWAETADAVAGLMSGIVLFHELGHYYLTHATGMFPTLYNENERVLKPFFELLQKENYVPAFIEEIKCDIFAVYSLFMTDKGQASNDTLILRSAVIGYSVFAVLKSLQKSAEATAVEQKKEPDNVVLKSIKKSNREYTYQVGVYTDMVERARWMTILCEMIAADKKITLYGDDDILPLREDVSSYLNQYINEAMVQNNSNERAIAKLVAEAFFDHPDGIEHLYLNSKVFKSARKIDDDVSS